MGGDGLSVVGGGGGDFGAEFGHGDLFDLADAFFGEAEALADLLVGGGGAFVEAIVGGEDVAFAVGEMREEGVDFVAGEDARHVGGGLTVGKTGEKLGVAGGGVGGGQELGDGAGEAFHEGEGGIGAEAVATMDVEAVDGPHEGHIAFADEFEEGDAGAEVLASDADDEAEVGADDGVLGGGGGGEVGFELAKATMADEFGVEVAAGLDELVLVEVEFEEEGPLLGLGEEARAVEVLEVRGEVARDAEVFALRLVGQFLLADDGFDGGGGGGLVIEGIVEEGDLPPGEAVDAVVHDDAVDGGA